MYVDGLRLIDDHIGPLARVPGFLRAYGVSGADVPTPEQMRKWRTRGHVPATALVPILAILEIEKGQPVSLAGYLEAGEDAETD